MIDAVICDLDGVLRVWPGDATAAIERRHGLEPGSIFEAAFEPELLGAAVTGVISDADWRRRVAEALGDGTAAREAVAEWSRLRGKIDAETLELVQSLRARVPVVLLSNATTRLEQELEELGIEAAFDSIASSSRLGVAKPDPEVFRAAARLVGAEPERCVAIDDQPKHLDGARAAGMTVIQHLDAASTHAALAALLTQ